MLAVIIPHPETPQGLVLAGETGWTLPTVALEHAWPLELERLNQALGQTLGISVSVLRRVAGRVDTAQRRAYMTYLLENHSPDWVPPAHGRWVRQADLGDLAWAVPEHRAVLAECLAEVESGRLPEQRVPWARPGWLTEARAWVEAQLTHLGTPLVAPIEQVKNWGLSCLLRAPTADGAVYFKATATLPLFVHEPTVMAGLAQMYPQHVPAPLCWDGPRRWMLLPDIGTVLGNNNTLEARTTMLHLFGTMQRDSASRVEELFAIGCVDRRPERLAVQLDALLQDADALAGLNEAEMARFQALGPRLQTTCARLAQSPLPPTLVHGDLHLKNVAVKAGRYQFFDWTDACVTHPFLDMSTIYNEADAARHTYLRDTYLAPWTAYAPVERLLVDWTLAEPLCHLHQAISYQQIVAGLEPSAQAEFRRMVPYYVRKLLLSQTEYQDSS
jgi:hypothetical protein